MQPPTRTVRHSTKTALISSHPVGGLNQHDKNHVLLPQTLIKKVAEILLLLMKLPVSQWKTFVIFKMMPVDKIKMNQATFGLTNIKFSNLK